MDHSQPIEVDRNVDCDVCGGIANEIAPCGHGFCLDCLNQMTRVACEDGERWPPRCCTWDLNLDSKEILSKLLPEVLRLVESRRAYYATRNKLFCCQSKCRKYISPAAVDESTNVGFCKACWGGTCCLCRRQPHIGNCRKDFQQSSIEKYLINKGWKKCQQCGSIVEKDSGCNHMTCNCGEEFCYICGQHWRNCDCPQSSEYTVKHDDLAEEASPWFGFPQQPRCYGREFLVNTCLPQTFFCAKCGHRCGKSGQASYQCQDCGRHLCVSCVTHCVDGRYHNPDWNAEPADGAEFLDKKTKTEEPTPPLTTAQSGPEEN